MRRAKYLTNVTKRGEVLGRQGAADGLNWDIR